MASELLRLRVERIRDEAALIRSFLLVDPQGASLPGFSPGAHVDLHLANGLVRSYSLLNQPGSGKAYEIAVARDAPVTEALRVVRPRAWPLRAEDL